MMPYNICENKWVSKTSKKLSGHYREYQPMYEIVVGIFTLITIVLFIITTLSHFLPI